MAKVKIVTRYDYDSIERPGVDFNPETDPGAVSMTNQADKDGSDINKIMARFEKTGVLVFDGVSRQPSYGDFSAIGDYHSMLTAIKRADLMFAQLPVTVRNRFDNDPQKLIDWLGDQSNVEEAVKLGLMDEEALVPIVEAKEAAQAAKRGSPAKAGDAGQAEGAAGGSK